MTTGCRRLEAHFDKLGPLVPVGADQHGGNVVDASLLPQQLHVSHFSRKASRAQLPQR